MPAASSRWPKARTTRACSGSSRKCAASAARRLPRPARLRKTVSAGRLRGPRRHDFAGGDRRLRRSPADDRAKTWINERIRTPLPRAVRHRPLPHGRDLGGRRAGRRALRRAARRAPSSARACSHAASAMPRRWRWSISVGAAARRRLPRCSTRSSSPSISARSAAIDVRPPPLPEAARRRRLAVRRDFYPLAARRPRRCLICSSGAGDVGLRTCSRVSQTS